jgi:hypothetical protein
MSPLAPPTLSTGFAADPLRDREGVLTPLFAPGVGCLFPAKREAAVPWFPDSTLTEAPPTSIPQLPTSSREPSRSYEPLKALSPCSPWPFSLHPRRPSSSPSGTARGKPPAWFW